MKTKLILSSCLSFSLIAACGSQVAARRTSIRRHRLGVERSAIKIERLDLFDAARRREVPVVLYSSASAVGSSAAKKSKPKLAIISHGYGGKHTDYSFIAADLVAHGYLVASIQHQLPSDAPLPMTGNIYEARKPSWASGVRNILFVLKELKKSKPHLDFDDLLLVGASHGGDTSMLFAHEHPKLVSKVISLDNRRMPLPRTNTPQILSLRSSDQPADAGVLPTQAEQERFGMKIIKLNDTIHNDMWDGATAQQKQQINRIISGFLGK